MSQTEMRVINGEGTWDMGYGIWNRVIGVWGLGYCPVTINTPEFTCSVQRGSIYIVVRQDSPLTILPYCSLYSLPLPH